MKIKLRREDNMRENKTKERKRIGSKKEDRGGKVCEKNIYRIGRGRKVEGKQTGEKGKKDREGKGREGDREGGKI